LVKEEMDEARVQNVYTTTFDFLRFLGLNETKELPDYEKLHSHDLLERLLTDLQQDNNQVSSSTTEEKLAA
jgi:chromosome segregation and condensation protein ScpB